MKSIGIKLADGSFYPILEEGTPSSKNLNVTTVTDNQTTVQIDVYRSESASMDDAEYVDSLEITNLKPHPNGEPDLSLDVGIDDNNELHAEVKDPETGTSSETTVKLVSRTEAERSLPVNFSIDSSPDSADTEEEVKEVIGSDPNSEEFEFDSIDEAALENKEENSSSDKDSTDNPTDIDFDFDSVADSVNLDSLDDNQEDTSIDATNTELPEIDDTLTNDLTSESDLSGFDFDSLDSPSESDENPQTEELDLSSLDLPDLDESSDDTPVEESSSDELDLSSLDLPDLDTTSDDTTVEDSPSDELDLSSLDLPDLDAPSDDTAVEDSSSDELDLSSLDLPDLDAPSDDTTVEDSSSDELDLSSLDLPDLDTTSDEDSVLTELSEDSDVTDDTALDLGLEEVDNNADLGLDSLDLPEFDKTIEDPAIEDLTSPESDDLQLPSMDEFDISTLDVPSDTPTNDQLSSEEVPVNNQDEGLLDLDLSNALTSVAKDDFDFPDFDDNSNSADSSGFDIPNLDTVSSPLYSEDLYDKETLEGNSKAEEDDVRKKTKAPVIICVICAIICVVAVLLLLFVIPSKINIKSKLTQEAITPDPVIETKLPEKVEEDDIPEQPSGVTEIVVTKQKEEPVETQQEQTKTEETTDNVVTQEEPPVTEEQFKQEDTAAQENQIVVVSTPEIVVPETPPAPAKKAEDIRYKVKWGDTLWDIAKAYYKNPWRYTRIAKYNNLSDPDHIVAGTIILIPAE